MSRSTRLLTSVPPAQSARFVALARQSGVSTSKLLAHLVNAALAKSALPEQRATHAAAPAAAQFVPPAKYTVRLHGLDAAALERRAATREMPVSSYAAQVLRAHLREDPPMPQAEFEQLKRVANELGTIRASLVQLVASDNPGRFVNAELADAVRRLLPALKTVREDVQNALLANTKSWGRRDGS